MIKRFYEWLMDTKLFQWGFNQNWAVWFHILGGGIGAKIALIWLSPAIALLVIFLITILWEVLEFVIDGGEQGMIDIYGSLERWFYDSLGDVIGANLMALTVVI
jgi:hypothetical protein